MRQGLTALLAVLMLLTACGSQNPPPTPTGPIYSNMELPAAVSVNVGSSTKADLVTFTANGARYPVTSAEVTFTMSPSGLALATFDAVTGKVSVSGLKVGTATLTAKLGNLTAQSMLYILKAGIPTPMQFRAETGTEPLVVGARPMVNFTVVDTRLGDQFDAYELHSNYPGVFTPHTSTPGVLSFDGLQPVAANPGTTTFWYEGAGVKTEPLSVTVVARRSTWGHSMLQSDTIATPTTPVNGCCFGDDWWLDVQVTGNGDLLTGGAIFRALPGMIVNGGLIARFTPHGELLWLRSAHMTQALQVTEDSAGNLYAAGFGPGAGSHVPVISSFDRNGNFRWQLIIPQQKPTVATLGEVGDVQPAPGGGVWFAGWETDEYVSGRGYDFSYLVGQVSEAGTLQWIKAEGVNVNCKGYPNSAEFARRLVPDGQGGMYVLGSTEGNLDGEQHPCYEGPASPGAVPIVPFASRYDASGTRLWTRLLTKGGIGNQEVHDAALVGNRLIVSPRAASVESTAVRLWSVSPDGAAQWDIGMDVLPNMFNDWAVAATADGKIMVSGGGCIDACSNPALGFHTALIDPANGNMLWSRGVETEKYVSVRKMMLSAGRMVMVGWTSGDMLGMKHRNIPIASARFADGFLIAVDSTGQPY